MMEPQQVLREDDGMTTTDESTAGPLRPMFDQILQAGVAVSSPAELLNFLDGVSTLAIGIEGGLASAAWRGYLSNGAPIDDRPPMDMLRDDLHRGDLNAENPSAERAALGQSILAAMRAAQTLRDALAAAWSAGIAEDTRLKVEQAHAKRSTADLAYYSDMMGAIGNALGQTVPAQYKGAALAALEREMTAVRERHSNS